MSEEECVLTPMLKAILESGDDEAVTKAATHVKSCQQCQAEIERLKASEPSIARELLENLIMGVGIMAAITLFFGGRGIADAYNKAFKDSGGTPPPWYRG